MLVEVDFLSYLFHGPIYFDLVPTVVGTPVLPDRPWETVGIELEQTQYYLPVGVILKRL
jgi:hypothetical protein